MELSANGPMDAVEATPMSKYGQKLKSFKKVVDFIFEPKWPLWNSKQLWSLKIFS